MDRLTPRQEEVLRIIEERLNSGLPPTLREIAADLGVSGTMGITKHLEALEKKGFIRREQGSSRGILLVGSSGSRALPVVGTVRAGSPQPAMEEIEGLFAIDASQVRGEGCFFLRVKGDSMIEAGIREGDLALIRPQRDADNGDIVVVLIDGEATLKRFFRERGRVRLQPENRDMEPIILTGSEGEVAVIGKLSGIYRCMERTA